MATLFDKIPADISSGYRFSPRDFQIEGIEAYFAQAPQYSRQLEVLPTGSGKTIMFNLMCERMVNHFGRQAMIIANRDELINQTCDKLFATTGIDPQIEKGKSRADLDAPIIVSSIQSLCNRFERYGRDQFGLIVLDEAHLTLSSTYMRTMEYFRDSPVCGFTATPDRGDKKDLSLYYNNIAYEISLYEMIKKRGWLVPIVTHSMPINAAITKDMGSNAIGGGGVNQEKVHQSILPYLKEVADKFIELAHDRKTLAFFPLIKTAKMFAEILRDKGMKAEYVHGKDPERTEKLDAFTRDDIRVLCNSSLLLYGYDEPSIDCILNMRPMRSRPLYTQEIGRGTRPLTGLLEGVDCPLMRIERIQDSFKPNLLVIDPLYVHEDLSLVKAPALIAQDKEKAELMMKKIIEASKGMKAGGGGDVQLDLFEISEQADHDIEVSLRKKLEARKKKKKNVVDPVDFCLDLGNVLLADYRPVMQWESDAATQKQLDRLAHHKVDTDEIQNKGHAAKVIDVIENRINLGLSSPNQVRVLKRNKKYLETLRSKGEEANPIKMTFEEASGHIDWMANHLWNKGRRR